MASPDFGTMASLFNQAADFNAAVVDDVYVAIDRSARSLILFSPAAKGGQPDAPELLGDTLSDEQFILIVSLVAELVGLVAGLAGLVLPKVPMGPLTKALLPKLKSPAVRSAITQLLHTLASTQATLADKAGAIVTFLMELATLGILSEIIAEMVKDLSWWDYARMALQIGLFIAALLTGGLAVKLAVALLTSVGEIVEKVRKIV
jgi:hypothetical protein